MAIALFSFSFFSQAQTTYPPVIPGDPCWVLNMDGCSFTLDSIYRYTLLACGPYISMPASVAEESIRDYYCEFGEFPENVSVVKKEFKIAVSN